VRKGKKESLSLKYNRRAMARTNVREAQKEERVLAEEIIVNWQPRFKKEGDEGGDKDHEARGTRSWYSLDGGGSLARQKEKLIEGGEKGEGRKRGLP